MKKRISFILSVIFAMCMMPLCSYAASDTASVSKYSELAAALDDSSVSVITVTAEIKGSKNGIPEGTILDLRGKTINSSVSYPFRIDKSGISIVNGTINKGGINLTSDADASGGSISGLTIVNAPDNAIRIAGSIGSITDNTIKGTGSVAILVQNGASVKGDISGNTLTDTKGTENGAIYINNGSSVTGGITGNTIENSKAMGIRLFSKASCGDISGNTISGTANHAISLNGSSTASANDGCTAGNISGNTITNCQGHGISIYHGSRCSKITGNTLNNIGGAHCGDTGDFAITVNSGCGFDTYADEITNNYINGITNAGIVVFSNPRRSKKSSADCRYKGYLNGDISGNTVINSGTWTSNIDWTSRNIDSSKYVCEGAIYVDSYAIVKGDIHDNTVTNAYFSGINIITYSKVNSVYKNVITNATNAGIGVADHSTVTGSILSNTIETPSVYGIFVNNGSKISSGKVSGNKIIKPGVNGIAVMKSSNVKTISSNTITNASAYGVISASKSTIKTLSNNTISTNNEKTAMPVLCNTNCAINNIKNNKLSGKYTRGIRIKTPTAKIKVTGNTITNSNKTSKIPFIISVEGCKNKTITITGNKITGNGKGPGIYLKTSSATVKKNTIRKVTKQLIVVKSKYKVTTK